MERVDLLMLTGLSFGKINMIIEFKNDKNFNTNVSNFIRKLKSFIKDTILKTDTN